MKLVRRPEQFRSLMQKERLAGRRIGFVPTMGALHEGHQALVKAARKENDVVAVSIFVNPSQFGPKEDFKKYPRTPERDRRLLAEAGSDYLFMPSAREMYAEGPSCGIRLPGELKDTLCGRFRPGHFEGVATVVAKLFNLARPHKAYFGAKDFQQTVVVGRLISDLDFGIRLRVMPTVREKDGLAMSSRNRYLSHAERQKALALSRALFFVRSRLKAGEKNLVRLKAQAVKMLREGASRIDYLEIVDPFSLKSLARPQSRMVAAAACRVGKTRLIDNVIISV